MKILSNLYKTIIYRTISIILLFIIIYIVSGDIEETTTLTIFIEIIKTLQYFIYDYIWSKRKCLKENT